MKPFQLQRALINPRAAAVLMSGMFSLLLSSPAASRETLPKITALQAVLGVPPAMASVKEGYVPPGQRRLHYVLIEDVHGNPEAQGKIAAILLFAHHHWGSRQAFVEGAFGPVGPPPFPLFTAERGELSINELLKRGLCSGGELAAALTSHALPEGQAPFQVIGMDDRELYRRQLEISEEAFLMQKKALTCLSESSRLFSAQERRCLWRLLERRMTPEDHRLYRQMPRPVIPDPELARAVALGEAYYLLTDLRTSMFARNTRERIGNGPCLLVMGGYHTLALTRILKNRQESFIVLAPRITQNGGQALYQRSLMKSLETLRTPPADSLYSSAVGFLRLTLAHKRQMSAAD